jgi:hypothetical protein
VLKSERDDIEGTPLTAGGPSTKTISLSRLEIMQKLVKDMLGKHFKYSDF